MKKRTIYGWFSLICGFLTCVYFNAFLGNQQGLLLEPISTALNMPRTLYSSIMSIAAVVSTISSIIYPTAYKKLGLRAMSIIGALPMGGLIEKFGCRMVLIPMFILIGLGMFVLVGSSVSLPVLYFASVLMGVGFSTFNVPIAMMALEVAGEKGVVQVQSYYFSIMNAGMIFGPPLFNIIYDAQGTYHMAYIMGLVRVVVLIAAVFLGTGRKKA